MWCFVSEPNGTIHELILPKGSRGLDCLEMVSSRIHLIETDYFGLRHINPSTGVETWINLRNKLSTQLHGRAPFRIQLVVKFFVKVQELQQPITREFYYSTLVQHLLTEKINLNTLDKNIYTKLIALIAQVEYGDFDAEAVPDYSSILPFQQTWSTELQQMVETEHLNLDTFSASQAKVQFLMLASELQEYGIESFHVQSVGNEKPEHLHLTVRHDGLRIYKTEKLKSEPKFIPYDEISTVSYKGKRFTIVHGNDRTDHTHSSFQMKKNHAAIHLFRTFTEFHSFYQCNIVKKSVIDKCSQSSFGKVMSVFKSNSGKMFLFDVLRTRRQAYDHAWSILNAPDKKRQSAFYHSERNFNRKSVYSLSKVEDAQDYSASAPQDNQPASSEQKYYIVGKKNENENEIENENENEKASASKDKNDSNTDITSLSVEELRETVNNLLDNQTCQVCMDAKVSTAFCPCGHVVCCVECAVMCRECPLCRTQITYAQRVFFSST